MAFIPVPDVAKAAVTYVPVTGQENTNTLWFRKPGFIVSDLTNLASALVAWWETEILPNLQSTTVLNTVEVYDMSSSSAPKFTAPGTGATGGQTPEVMPANVALVITFNTLFRGRSGRGRNYVGCLSEGSVSGNRVDNTIAANILQGYVDITTYIDPLEWTWGIVSFQQDGIVRSQGEFRDITSPILTDNIVDSQRRRLP